MHTHTYFHKVLDVNSALAHNANREGSTRELAAFAIDTLAQLALELLGLLVSDCKE